MVDEVDVWRTAQGLVKHHGTDAPDHALRRADALALQGATTGAAVMRRVAVACRELLADKPKGSGPVH